MDSPLPLLISAMAIGVLTGFWLAGSVPYKPPVQASLPTLRAQWDDPAICYELAAKMQGAVKWAECK